MSEFLLVLFISAISLALLLSLVMQFLKKKLYVAAFSFPSILFSAGFAMRLSGMQEIIDMGFYLTEYSFLFVYTMIAVAFMLGEIKYWKKN